MKILRFIHTLYGVVVFGILFLLFFLPLCVPMVDKRRHAWTGLLNRAWARILFASVLLPVRVHIHPSLKKNGQYIFCANHFSYLDIPAMGLTPVNAIFVGKSAMERIPLFGLMYRSLHITVDRSRLRSRFLTLQRTMEALEEGKSLIIFPEGGMKTQQPPRMVPFKDGAFRAAVEKGIPLVPVTIPFNWRLLPDEPFPLLRWGKMEIIFHEPISVAHATREDIPRLKSRVFQIIEQRLAERNSADPVDVTEPDHAITAN